MVTLPFILFELLPFELCASQNRVRSKLENHLSYIHKYFILELTERQNYVFEILECLRPDFFY